MPVELQVGVVDSGHAAEQASLLLAGRRFFLTDAGLGEGPLLADALGHGSAVLHAIATRASAARFSVAQVFDARGVTSPLQIAAALHWLRERGVRLVNLSLGVRQDRPILREAVAALVADGALVCASSPARGEAVFPAAYPGVLRVTGDARCAEGQWSWLDSAQADFGAPLRVAGRAGASLGCAAFCGYLAALLIKRPELSNEQALAIMRARAAYRGIERKVGP